MSHKQSKAKNIINRHILTSYIGKFDWSTTGTLGGPYMGMGGTIRYLSIPRNTNSALSKLRKSYVALSDLKNSPMSLIFNTLCLKSITAPLLAWLKVADG